MERNSASRARHLESEAASLSGQAVVARRPVCVDAPALALTVTSGVAYGLAFPPLALRPLAWVALVPFLIAIRRGSLARSLALGAVWACAMTYVTSDCLPGAVINYYKQSALVGWLMLLGATVVTMVPWYATFAAAYWLLSRRYRVTLPVLAGAAWVSAELARVTVLGGNPWAVSGYSQTGFLTLMQISDLAGVHGVGFLLVTVNATLVELLLARGGSSRRRSAAWASGVAAAGLVAGALAYGTYRRASLSVEDLDAPIEVAIVQGNLDLSRQWRRDMYGRNLDQYLRLTHEAIRAASPRLVFWPESAMTFFVLDEPAYRSALGSVLAPGAVQLIAGGPRASPSDDTRSERYFNSTFLISARGDVLGWQDKLKLLPFAEYFPLQSVDLLQREFGQARQFTPGDARPPLASVAGQAGVIVCNESMYPEQARQRVGAGAEFLVNPANDSWFGSPKYSQQAFDIARWRAVEQRRYLVRTSTAGPSGIVDPLGRVVVESKPFTRGWISGGIRASRAKTPYHRVGDLFAVVCVVTTIVACAFHRERRDA